MLLMCDSLRGGENGERKKERVGGADWRPAETFRGGSFLLLHECTAGCLQRQPPLGSSREWCAANNGAVSLEPGRRCFELRGKIGDGWRCFGDYPEFFFKKWNWPFTRCCFLFVMVFFFYFLCENGDTVVPHNANSSPETRHCELFSIRTLILDSWWGTHWERTRPCFPLLRISVTFLMLT